MGWHPSLDSVLLQYGAIGVIAVMALAAVRVLFSREVKSHEADSARADRAEAALSQLNEAVRAQYISTLTQATSAITDTLQVVREMRELFSREAVQTRYAVEREGSRGHDRDERQGKKWRRQ